MPPCEIANSNANTKLLIVLNLNFFTMEVLKYGPILQLPHKFVSNSLFITRV